MDPTVAGDYLISLALLDPDTGTEVNTTGWYTIYDPLTSINIGVQFDTPQPGYMTITADVMGGWDVQYQFWLYNPNATPAWDELQAYSPSNTCVCPEPLGDWFLSVTAENGPTGKEVYAEYWATID